MSSDNKVLIKLVLYQPDRERNKNYAAIVLRGQVVLGEWYTAEHSLAADDLLAYKERFQWFAIHHGFEYCEKPPLVSM